MEPRIQAPQRAEWSDEVVEVARRISETRGGIPAPFALLLHIPEAAIRVADVGEYLRFRGRLRADVREAAIIATARERNCRFELDYHQPLAIQAGLAASEVKSLALGEDARLPDDMGIVDSFVRELCRNNDVADETYRRAIMTFGVAGVVELATLVGYYSLIAAILNTARLFGDEVSVRQSGTSGRRKRNAR